MGRNFKNECPRLLYLLQAIPIKLPTAFFTSFKSACRTFLWAKRPARLKWDRLTLPKLRSGIGLPNLSRYHKACLLKRVVDWHVHRRDKEWVELEEAFVGFWSSHLPWIDPVFTPTSCSSHPLISPTLSCLKATNIGPDAAPFPGPMTLLNHNPSFPNGISTTDPQSSQSAPSLRAFQFFDSGTLLSESEMALKFPDFRLPRFKFFQLRHFFRSTPRPTLWYRDLTQF